MIDYEAEVTAELAKRAKAAYVSALRRHIVLLLMLSAIVVLVFCGKRLM